MTSSIANKPWNWQWQSDRNFDTPKTETLYRFLETEANNRRRVTGLSIEDDGVFIYTDSSEWCDDAGAGTFRGDSETAAIRHFKDRVMAAEELYADDDDDLPPTCPACGSQHAPIVLGQLGNLVHYRCRACGIVHNG